MMNADGDGEGNRMLRTLIKGAWVVLVATLLSKFLGYLYRIIVARMGTEDYGILSLGLAVTGVLSAIATLGLSEGVTRYLSYYKGKKDENRMRIVISSSARICLFSSLFFGILVFFLSDWIAVSLFHAPSLSIVLKVLSFAIPFDALSIIFFSATKSFYKMEYEMYGKNIAGGVVRFVLTLILVALGYGLTGASAAYFLSVIFIFAISLFYLEKTFPFILKNPADNNGTTKKLMFYSLPLLFSTFVSLITLWTDTFMIGFFKNASEVGIYNVASPTAQLMFVFPSAFIALLFPMLTEIYARKEISIFKSFYQLTTKWIMIINTIPLLLFVLVGKEFLSYFFGADYSAGFVPLIILSLGHFIIYLSLTSSKILLVLKKTKLVLFNTLLGAVLNVGLNLHLIPAYGITGAAIGTSACFLLMAFLQTVEANIFLNFSSINARTMLKIAFSAGVSFFASSYLYKNLPEFIANNELLLMISVSLVFVIVYFAGLFILKSFDREDSAIFKTITAKAGTKQKPAKCEE